MKQLQFSIVYSAFAAFWGLYGIFAANCVVAEAAPKGISQQRRSQIVSALLSDDWQLEMPSRSDGVLEGQVERELQQIWSGNIPKFDLRLSSLTVNFMRPDSSTEVAMDFDTSEGVLRVGHSLVSSPRYRGGVRFDSERHNRVHRQLLLGAQGTSVFIFTPTWQSGSDLHILVCPRSLDHIAGNDLVLGNKVLQPESLVWKVAGKLKAVLFSGTGAGSILATIENSAGVPAAREQSDTARGLNPVADLVYQPIASHKPDRFISADGSNQFFLMAVDMKLPAGYRRKVVEGFDLSVSQVIIPAVEVVVPIETVLETKAAQAVPERLRAYPEGHGLKAQLQSGECTLVVAERRAREELLFDRSEPE